MPLSPGADTAHGEYSAASNSDACQNNIGKHEKAVTCYVKKKLKNAGLDTTVFPARRKVYIYVRAEMWEEFHWHDLRGVDTSGIYFPPFGLFSKPSKMSF